ncbi:hypothetical protein AX17_006354 [Amanita inopinata Kibby_2008]|nr:hypothetical protein AX17_006354 [Amanita inopinata Kibby_2008]
MPPSEFSLRLQHGITGGFAPPTPNAIHTITLASNYSADSTNKEPLLQITSAVRADGTPHLQDAFPKSLAFAQHSPHVSLVDELHGILKVIPTESPPGSQDIYGLDTSIAWMSEDLMWCNGGPQGCGGGTSTVQASDEEKAKFRRAVAIVNELVKQTQ